MIQAKAARAREPEWYNAPVKAWGDPDGRLLIVGLAPGMQGANRTGRPFTGDYAGDLLYATLLEYGFARGQLKLLADPFLFAKSLSDPGNPEALINESVQLLYAVDMPEKEKKYMKEGILLSNLQGKMSDHYWTDAWQKMINNPDDAANKKDVTNKLRNLYKYIMNLPQYQLC